MLPTNIITVITSYLTPQQIIPFLETHNIQKNMIYDSSHTYIPTNLQNLLINHPLIAFTSININIHTQQYDITKIAKVKGCMYESALTNIINPIFKIIQTLANLKTLVLLCPTYFHLTLIPTFKKLKTLNIINAKYITFLPALPITISFLRISNSSLTNINPFILSIQDSSLTHLIIRNAPIKNIDSITTCPNLKTLSLYNTQIHNIPTASIPNLKKLTISNVPIHDIQLTHLIRLTHLTLHKIPSFITSITIPHPLLHLILIHTHITTITTSTPKTTITTTTSTPKTTNHHTLCINQHEIPTLSPIIYSSCTHLNLKSRNLPNTTILQKFSSVTHLKLTNYTIDMNIISNFFKKLKKLTFNDCTITSTPIENNSKFDSPSNLIIENCYNNTLTHLHLLNYNYIIPTYTFHLNALTTLELNNLTISSLNFLDECTQLINLHITNLHKITTLDPIINCISLKVFTLQNCTSLTNLIPLTHLSTLEILQIFDFPHPLSSLPSLPNPNLHHITFTHCPHLTSTQHIIQYGPNIQTLEVAHCDNLHDITTLSTSKHLTLLSLIFCNKLTDLSTLNINTLLDLNLNNCPNLKHIPAPKFGTFLFKQLLKTQYIMPNLTSLDLSYCPSLKNIKSASSYGKLEKINITSCPGLKHIPKFNDRIMVITGV